MFFGGEPLLNLPVMYRIADRAWDATRARGVWMGTSIITNGLLLTRRRRRSDARVRAQRREDYARRRSRHAQPDAPATRGPGDVRSHHRQHPAGCGPRADRDRRATSTSPRSDSYPALLDFLSEQEFARKLSKVSFKPVIRNAPAEPARLKGVLPLTPVGHDNRPLGGTCMTSAGKGGAPGGSTGCDSCGDLDDALGFLRVETERRGFPTRAAFRAGRVTCT